MPVTSASTIPPSPRDPGEVAPLVFQLDRVCGPDVDELARGVDGLAVVLEEVVEVLVVASDEVGRVRGLKDAVQVEQAAQLGGVLEEVAEGGAVDPAGVVDGAQVAGLEDRVDLLVVVLLSVGDGVVGGGELAVEIAEDG